MQNRGFQSDFLGELKRKNDLVDVASNYLKLEQKGRRFWACCPFHNEKTASFAINADEGIYFCFGCKESGDVIKFVQKMESLDFLDAVKFLAERAGMQIPETFGTRENKEIQQKKNRILSALDYAYKHYMENLYNQDAKVAQDYIKLRKFTRRELEDFKIGYSKNWTDIVEYLKSKGFSDEEIIEAGIANRKDNRLLDCIGGRLVFPIFNSFNECIGFSARALEKTEFAKYKNTAETLVFQKGRVVFGINLLKAQKQQQLLDKIILVEGQMDVIAMHKSGFKSAVACMGTALTKDHISELKKINQNIYLCFDNDSAGEKATVRAIEMFRNEDVNLKVVKLADGKDPDEVLNNVGKEKLLKMIENAQPYMEYLIDYYKSKYDLDDAEQKGKFVKDILKEISKLGSPILFEPYLEKIRDITNIPLEILRRDIGKTEDQKTYKVTKVEVNKPNNEKIDEKAPKYLLAALLHKKKYVDEKIDYQKLLNDYRNYLEIINQNLPISSVFDIEGASEDKFLMEIVNFNFADFKDNEERIFRECLWKVAETKLKKNQEELNEEYKNCEDLNKRGEIARKLGKLALQIKNKSLEEFSNGRR